MNFDAMTISVVAAISAAVVQVLKKGIPALAAETQLCPLVAIGVGILTVACGALAGLVAAPALPQAIGWVLLHGLLAGLTSSGGYDVARQLGSARKIS